MLKKIGGGHLLNEIGDPSRSAKKIATQIKSAARGSDTGIFPLKKMAKSKHDFTIAVQKNWKKN